MRSARPRRRHAHTLAAVALLGVFATAVGAQERQDSVVESARSTRVLGDQTIRVLLAYGTSSSGLDRDASGTVMWNGRRYRGTIDVVPTGAQVAVINRVELEDYLRGVLPGEIGSRDPRDRAALQAQAVAARSYAAARMGERRALFDVTATVSDQVYGGVSVERVETDDAVRVTRGLVLTWGDRIITAPYSSHAGVTTAAPDEVFWKRGGEPFLRSVDDRAPTGGCFCDASGSRGWERRFTFAELHDLLVQHGRDAGVTSVSEVRAVRVASRGPSGRVTALEIEMATTRAVVRGNDIRFLLRTGGNILPSTSFQLEVSGSQLVLRGVGNGHGVGMSQWGAIGRARAGQDARAILAAYYPGTRLSPLL